MRYRLYKQERCSDTLTKIEVQEFCPSPFKRLFVIGECWNFKIALIRIYFWMITKGKAEIFYIASESGNILHTSYVLPRCYKFSFMDRMDYEIGPCNTIESARRKGLYITTLNYIVRKKQGSNVCFWMLVNEKNEPSIRGIEKAGFVLDGYAQKTSIVKRYCRIGDV